MTATAPNRSASPTASQDGTFQIRDIIQSLPKACFEQDPVQAWGRVVLSVVAVALSYVFLAIAPWYLLPFAWAFAGTALTGFFVIAHDCGHRSFSKRRWVNDWVGHIFLLPLIYPFHAWRLLHNYHHTHTNKLDVDNAWQPCKPEEYGQLNSGIQVGYRALRSYFWWVGSIAHWLKLHFDWTTFEGKERQQVKLSVLVVLGFALIAFPTLILTTGVWGFIKFWVMPWLGYHFWMSTFTLVHHTAMEIPFKPASEWNAVEAQLVGTVHCDYPRWVEVLCHDISVHVPHHISTAIPSYRLRMAHQSLKENWGDYVRERRFDWTLIKEIVNECHLYERDRNYQSFKDYHLNNTNA